MSVYQMIDFSIMTRHDISNVSKQYADVGILYVSQLISNHAHDFKVPVLWIRAAS